MSRVRQSAIVATYFLLTAVTAASPPMVFGESSSPIIFTEDRAVRRDGCDAVTIYDGVAMEHVHSGTTFHSPGRIAADPKISLVIGSATNGSYQRDDSSPHLPFLWFAESNDRSPSGWRDGVIIGPEFASFGAVAILPGAQAVIATVAQAHTVSSQMVALRGIPPYRLGKAPMPAGGSSVRRLRLNQRSSEMASLPVEALLDPDGRNLHVVTAGAMLHSLDVDSLDYSSESIALEPYAGTPNSFYRDFSHVVHAAQSDDGRHIITNRWESNQLNVADVVERRAWTVELGVDVKHVGGVALGRHVSNDDVLAVHIGSRILTFLWNPMGPQHRLGELDIGAPPNHRELTGPSWSIAWTEEGDRIVAAVDHPDGEFMLIDVAQGGRSLSVAEVIQTCPGLPNLPNDIWTASSILPTYTPTLTPTPSRTPTLTTTPSATTPASRPPAPTPSRTPTHAPSPTPTNTQPPPPTPTPAPIFLPILLRESCTPDQQRADVVLIVDASTSMLETTAAGRSKLTAAIAAAGAFLDQLRLDAGDQAAIVSFNADAVLRTELTALRPILDAALASITPASQTCLVCGVDVAATELASARHRADNTPVLILLTDGLSNPRPASEAVQRAAEAKAAGVVIHTIGLGDTLDFEALEAMANEPDDFHRAPDAEDLAAIYAQIAVEIPCPPSRYWGRR